MQVLVTGGCGFIGSALVRRLLADGHQVINIDKLAAAANASLDNYCEPQYELLKWDLAECQSEFFALLDRFKPQHIFHLAAETHVDNSIQTPHVSVQNNVLSAMHLLDAVRTWRQTSENSAALKNIVMVSTDEVYGDCADHSQQHLFRETDCLHPSSPYSASKAAADQLALAWRRTFNLPIIISRCSNNYGPWQYPEKLIPKFLARALAGQPLPLYGDGLQQREWLYVDDHVNALLLLAERGKLGEIYNVGSDEAYTNLEVAQQLLANLEKIYPNKVGAFSSVVHVADRLGHDRSYRLCCEKICALGWRPVVNFSEGLEKTVLWTVEQAEKNQTKVHHAS